MSETYCAENNGHDAPLATDAKAVAEQIADVLALALARKHLQRQIKENSTDT